MPGWGAPCRNSGGLANSSGCLLEASALGRRGWVCWRKENSLPLPWRGEPDPLALCHSGSRLGRAGTWQPFSLANLSLGDQLDSGEPGEVTSNGQPLENVLGRQEL